MNRFLTIMVGCSLVFGLISGVHGSEGAENRMKPALLVIDIQNAYLPMMDESGKERALKVINFIIGIFRANQFPIIRIYHTDPKYGPGPGSDPFKYPDIIQIKNEDPQVIKNYPNAFKKTNLEKMLREKHVNTLFLCGLSSVGCVISTYFGAIDLDFDTFLLNDALLGPDSSHTKSIEMIFNALGFKALKVMLENARN